MGFVASIFTAIVDVIVTIVEVVVQIVEMVVMLIMERRMIRTVLI